MAYAGIDNWRAIYSPMLRALQGDDDAVGFDEDWDEEGMTLDPWAVEAAGTESREGGAQNPFLDFQDDVELDPMQVRFQGSLGVNAASFAGREPESFDLAQFVSTDKDPGRQRADRTAAERGFDVRKRGGAGKLFDLARTFIGTPYVFGAGGPDAFDCSGFVQYLFDRVYGAKLPHNAAAQFSATKRVTREKLQAGDLIFYAYGRLGKGVVDHVEVYMGGNEQIGTSNPTEDLDVDKVDWDNVVGFGRVPGAAVSATSGGDRSDPMLDKPKVKVTRKPAQRDSSLAPAMLAGDYGEASFSTVLAEVLAGDVMEVTRKTKAPAFKGSDGAIKRQLYRGFMDAGRPDLAKMVGTRAFNTWVRQESGWQVGVTSPANNHGKPNDGLFQVWRGHDFNAHGEVSRMSPYEQAQIIAKYFAHLTPDAIRSYADAIRSGTYSGWG